MHILGVHLPLLGAAQPVVDGRLPLGRRVGVHQAAAQQHLGAAKGRKIGKVEVVLSGHARSGKIAGQGIQHRTALHLGQQAGRQQCQSAAEALSKSIHPFRVHPGQRQRGLGHGQRILIPGAELCLRGVSQPIALVRLGLQRHRTKAQRQKPRHVVPAAHAAVQIVVHQKQGMLPR